MSDGENTNKYMDIKKRKDECFERQQKYVQTIK